MINKIEEISFNLGELTLTGLAFGDKNDELLLCLHGWLDNAASFLPLMPYLKGKRVIALDWPGHGLSSHRSADAHYHFIDYVYDLLLLWETNQWQKIDIVAHSMGGMISSAFSAAFPEKVKSLTLLDSIGFISSDAQESTEHLRKGMLSRLKSNADITSSSKKKKIHPSLESAVNARVQVSDLSFEQAKLLVERGIIKEKNGFFWRSDSRLRTSSAYRLTLGQAKQFIQDISIPVQLIYGDKGLSFVQSGLKEFAPLFGHFSSHKLIGGHHFHMETPEATSRQILEFIS
ncbi:MULTISPECIES: alpha/beta fold hydrolase [unclassified Colwellia]|uniref:alpha/beta fold hydrolase n=1 Tax=unclassified Colwellia TaxID=196834 RepID=UPI0015F6AF17|nr:MULTISPECIES: alpha/beta hydrolase [unclassified Colwellia]MBA6233023.1 alpha/beta hydrolase [Colwellia sp. MB02u-7]MBA6236701.1 alpha/beta hydrolase [Colwellia sp. MB02u-11]MBA6255893.1 alpha/beta hydrolase [Colwellia sp. MB3u-28]MBA6262035.1 alpha/beta hydrolase [Colwellia sp. MB3u-41]MBA6299003.1 alpha/beta hydrolase [Colwellia sp. MB3u-22]